MTACVCTILQKQQLMNGLKSSKNVNWQIWMIKKPVNFRLRLFFRYNSKTEEKLRYAEMLMKRDYE